MNKKILEWAVGYLINKLDAKMIKMLLDTGLDKLESSIVHSENKFDDMLLPVITLIREALDISDNEEE